METEGMVVLVCSVCSMTSTLNQDELDQVLLEGEAVVCDCCGEGVLVIQEKETMNTKYKHVIAWGRYTGSFQNYINRQVARAEQDDAPEDSIFFSDLSGRWFTMADLASEHAKACVQFIIQQEGF